MARTEWERMGHQDPVDARNHWLETWPAVRSGPVDGGADVLVVNMGGRERELALDGMREVGLSWWGGRWVVSISSLVAEYRLECWLAKHGLSAVHASLEGC